jgi:hypothetical protein
MKRKKEKKKKRRRRKREREREKERDWERETAPLSLAGVWILVGPPEQCIQVINPKLVPWPYTTCRFTFILGV